MDSESRRALADSSSRRLTISASIANAAGAADVFLFLVFLLPASRAGGTGYGPTILSSGIAMAIYMPAALYLGWVWGVRRFEPVREWLHGDGPATDAVRRIVLGYPMYAARLSAAFWGVGAIGFSLLVLFTASTAIATSVFFTILLGGVTTSSVVYLLAERALRPAVTRALADGPTPRVRIPGVATRLTMAWTLATGVPLLGVVALAVADLAGTRLDTDTLVAATLFLVLLALAVGFLAILFAARAVADPIGSVRRELERVERGDFEASVPVDDGSEVGLLQVGFNRMAAGLRERERLREAFGTFVDPGLAERVARDGTDLRGDELEVSILFMDVCGFTSFAEAAPAREVVARLNQLYEIVVPAITAHGGHANKFIGDGLLAVFGAPERHPDHADRAVAAALEIADRISDHFRGELRVGLGVNSGTVVVGTIGGGGRLDFTVIGDAVNTAARVESATRTTGDDLLITEATRSRLTRAATIWEERPSLPLKGKSEEILLYAPAAAIATEVVGSGEAATA